MATNMKITKPDFPTFFGGFGFHNNEALFYRLIEKEHFDQKICKCYRELSPGFSRCFAGYPNWTKESMDTFADYYERMQKVTDTPIYFAAAKGQLHFNDEERKEYAENVASRLNYLKNERGVKQLRYYCYSNEMSMNDWGGLLEDLPLFQKYHELLFQAFQKYDLNIGLLATDAGPVEAWDTMDYAAKHMKRITEEMCGHHYLSGSYERMTDPDLYYWFKEKCEDRVIKSCQCDGKRFILGEVGVSVDCKEYGWFLNGVIRDVNGWYYNGEGALGALILADIILASINAGVFAIVIWTFTDYPDPYVCHYHSDKDKFAKEWGKCERFISHTQDVKYNKWGLMKWEDNGDYSVRECYYSSGLISRFCRRNAKVLNVECADRNIHTCGLLNRDGTVSICIVNRNHTESEIDIDLDIFGIKNMPDLRAYIYDSHNVPMNEFGDLQDYSETVCHNGGKFTYKLLPDSFTVLTTDYIDREDIYAENVKQEGNIISWDKIEDPLHCYYRVYRGETEDFSPSRENQIASTVAETLDLDARYLEASAIKTVKGNYYKVLSVNQKR